jgi:hypothetical protein
MKIFLACLMALNALVFFIGAGLHLGLTLGPFHQPQIFPAAIVEILCGISLCWGATAIVKGQRSAGRAALTANFLALAGILLGVLAPALRQRTWPVIALDHQIMLIVIGASLLSLFSTPAEVSTARTTNHSTS